MANSVALDRRKETLAKAGSSANAIFDSVGLFASVSDAFKDISIRLKSQSDRIVDIEKKLSEVFEVPVVPDQPATRDSAESISTISDRMLDRGFDLAKLALIIPLLLSEDARNYIASFISGLIGIDSLEKITFGLKALGAVLTGVFTYKLMSQVGDTVRSMLRLATLTATLFALTDETTDLNIEERRRRREKRLKDVERKKRSLERRRQRIEKIKKAKTAISTGLKGLKFTGLLTLGAIAADVAIGSFITYYTDQELKDLEKELSSINSDTDLPDAEKEFDSDRLIEIVKNELISSLTFGLINENIINNTKKVIAGDENTIAENRAEVSGLSVDDGMSTYTDYSEGGQFADSSAPIQEDILPRSTITPNKKDAVIDSTAPQKGASLGTTSEVIQSTKKQMMNQNQITINNIDNSAVVVTGNEKEEFSNTPIVYSTMVGA